MVTDTIAVILSLVVVFIHFIVSLELEVIKNFNDDLFAASIWFAIISMGAMVMAFVMGTHAMSAPFLGLAIITCLIGLELFLLCILVIRRYFSENKIMGKEIVTGRRYTPSF